MQIPLIHSISGILASNPPLRAFALPLSHWGGALTVPLCWTLCPCIDSVRTHDRHHHSTDRVTCQMLVCARAPCRWRWRWLRHILPSLAPRSGWTGPREHGRARLPACPVCAMLTRIWRALCVGLRSTAANSSWPGSSADGQAGRGCRASSMRGHDWRRRLARWSRSGWQTQRIADRQAIAISEALLTSPLLWSILEL
jgi:hypothetical protein